MSQGHVFVVQGALERLDYDAVIVSTDDCFRVMGSWAPVLGVNMDETGYCVAQSLKPDTWSSKRYGRSKEGVGRSGPLLPTWFIDAACYPGQTPEQALGELKERLAGTFEEIAGSGAPVQHGRARPLVALPTLGTGQGGFDAVRGRVIDALLEVCQRAVETTGIDVVVVARSSANYSALQARRRLRPDHERHLGPALCNSAKQVARRGTEGGLALFVGAGASIPAGLPSWEELVRLLSLRAGADVDVSGLEGAPLDQAELLRRALGADFAQAVVDVIGPHERYAITHAMLAALGCQEVVTTNYDQLYEMAASDVVGVSGLQVLPFGSPTGRGPWVLKMHGDTKHPASIVLSRSDFVSYDAKARPMGSIVQSLMITKHLLVVGASMTDDNFLRLAHEVLSFQAGGNGSAHARARSIGTVVTLGEEAAKARLWEGRFDYVAASKDGKGINEQARDLAIFLDLVAMLSAKATYVLDARYEVLLESDEERQAASAARDLLDQIDSLPGRWKDLAASLRGLGAGVR